MRPLLAWLLTACAALAATEAKRPNILFFIMDDWGNGHAGAYGCSWVKTPNFDRVAREGLLYTNAYTPTAKCAPSRSTIMTGRYPWQLGAAANHQCIFPPEYGISASFSSAALECSTGMLTRTRTLATIVASRSVQSPASQRGSRMPLKKAAGLYSDFFNAANKW